MELENKMYVQDETGKEIEMTIVCTFENPENGKQYVLYQNPTGDDEEVYINSYDEEGNLFVVDDPKELAYAEEVLGAINDEETEKE